MNTSLLYVTRALLVVGFLSPPTSNAFNQRADKIIYDPFQESPDEIIGIGLDSDAESAIGFTTGGLSVMENGGSAPVTITRSGGLEDYIFVPLILSNEDARAGVDFSPVPQFVIFEPGEVDKAISLTPRNNGLVDGGRRLEIRLGALPDGVDEGPISKMTVVFVDDEIPNAIDWSFEDSLDLILSRLETLDFFPTIGGRVMALTREKGVLALSSEGALDSEFQLDLDILDPVSGEELLEIDFFDGSGERLFLGVRNLDPDSGDFSNAITLHVFDVADGRLEFSFGPFSWSNLGRAGITSVKPFSNGFGSGFYVSGWFDRVGEFETQSLARLFVNGSVDTSFQVTSPASSPRAAPSVSDVVVAANDQGVLAAGSFLRPGDERPRGLERFLGDGTLDETFDLSMGASYFIHALARDKDGRILIGGEFPDIGENLLRLTPTLELDASFDAPITDSEIEGIVLAPDGGILIWGRFDRVGGRSQRGVARLLEDGEFDDAFTVNVDQARPRLSARVSDSGRIYFGNATAINDIPVGKLTALAPESAWGSPRVFIDPLLNEELMAEEIASQRIRTRAVRHGATDSAVSIPVEFNLGTGVLHEDYEASGEAFEFESNSSESALELAPVDDGFVEGRESVVLELLGESVDPENAVYSTYIEDNEIPAILDPSFKFAAGEGWEIEGIESAADGGAWMYGARIVGEDRRPGALRVHSDGSLDERFHLPSLEIGDDGAYLESTAFLDGTIHCMIPDHGGVILGGDFTVRGEQEAENIVRLTASGAWDEGFSDHLGRGPRGSVVAMEKAPSGKILVSGHFLVFDGQTRRYLARLEADGGLDRTFNPRSLVKGAAEYVGILSDERIVLSIGNRLTRLNDDASVDDTFDLRQHAFNRIQGLVVLPDDFLMVAGRLSLEGSGRTYQLVKLDSEGNIDESFGGLSTLNNVSQLRLYSDSSVAFALESGVLEGAELRGLARISTVDGSLSQAAPYLDNASSPFVRDFVWKEGQRPIVLHNESELEGIEVPEALRLDFSNPSRSVAHFESANVVGLESDGFLRVTVNRIGDTSGEFTRRVRPVSDEAEAVLDFAGEDIVARFEPLESSTVIGVPIKDDSDAEADERFFLELIGEDSAPGVDRERIAARILDNDRAGAMDTSFRVTLEAIGGEGSVSAVRQVLEQPDGRILIRGEFGSNGGTPVNGLARLTSEGDLDPSFVSSMEQVGHVALQSDGRLIVQGVLDGEPGVYRLNRDGAADPTFQPLGASGILGFETLPDDRIAVWGRFLSIRQVEQAYFAFLSADGEALDEASLTVRPNAPVLSAWARQDGAVVIAGEFNEVGSMEKPYLARIEENGRVDRRYPVDGGPDGPARRLSPVGNGGLRVEGDFKRYAGEASENWAFVDRDGRFDRGGAELAGEVVDSLGLLNGKWFAAGDIALNGPSEKTLIRFLPDHSRDESFDIGSGFADGDASGSIHDLELSRDGGLFVGGAFSSFNGALAQGLVKLNNEFLFAVEASWEESSGSLHVSFHSRPGDVYALEASGDFSDWRELDRLEATAFDSEWVVRKDSSLEFYRVARVVD